MRIILFVVSALITVLLIVTLNTRLIIPSAALGKLLNPQGGIWQNAESNSVDFSADLKFPQLKGKSTVYLDDRLVPHVFAENEGDLFFIQGFLHAKFRLFQMELQTYSAAGRASEIVGSIALQHDREFRRLGMVYAAENSLKEMEADPLTKLSCNSYTAGINAYINTLTPASLPIEYKLLDFKPEAWTNLKTALFLKYMSQDLAASESDFEMTNTREFLSDEDFAKLFPARPDSLDPIIPKGTVFTEPKVKLQVPADADSVYFHNKEVVVTTEDKPDKDNGSNNWAVAGSKTASGSPILCNDPHLGLHLPSLWFEMQLSTPEYNVYGATFPGSPGVIIGFNDNVAWGVTNGSRDVRDYYEIKFKDDTHQEYWLDSAWKKTDFRYEKIIVRNGSTHIDTVAYTVFGPVMYDKNFSGNRANNTKNYAVRWKGHDASNEVKAFMLLNRARDYNDYLEAVKNMKCPGQNFAFAAKNGDIAMRTQGEWPAKWKGQGDYIMPGTDTRYMWQAMIPQDETPFQYNPARAFVSSANQNPTDTSYPYYLGRGYKIYRGIIINRMLDTMTSITPQKMMAMQTNNYNVFGEMAVPLIIKNANEAGMDADEKKYFDILKGWDYYNAVDSKGATVFALFWKNFDSLVYADEYRKAPKVRSLPNEATLLDGITKDSAYKYLDNIETPAKETMADEIDLALKASLAELIKVDTRNRLEWGKYKSTTVFHLLNLAPLSAERLPIGGGLHCINATKYNQGPSWRMVVSLTPKTEAYGVYPGGQSGNPGSKFYDDFIDHWAAGTYYTLWMMTKEETKDKRVKWVMSFGGS